MLLLRRIGRPQWVTVISQETGAKELAFRIFGVNFGLYKDSKPIIYGNDFLWRPIAKREYGETIRPQ